MAEVRIRAASPDDAAELAELCMQPNVVWGTLQLPHQTPGSWRKRLEGNDPNTSYVLVAELGGVVVGMAGLFWTPRPRARHVGDLGMMVHDHYQGKGIGKQLMAALIDAADRWLNLLRVELEVYPDNPRAIRLYEQFGFQVEGRKRMCAWRDGEYVDSLVMGRIRPEVVQRPPVFEREAEAE